MSSVSAINSPSGAGAGGGLSGLSTNDFTRIILQELTRQDPLAPNDSNQLMQQIATIRSIQSNTDLSDSLMQISSDNSFSSAANMIGKVATGLCTDATRKTDEVVAAERTSVGMLLTLAGGGTMLMYNVEGVVDKTTWQNGGVH
ncbi:MAG: flagellar hook capping FlgD N-terminal domain-containing protein [Planctomycetota bacterium]